ncbi:hypothetical protein SELMODRAFT_415732 [Selaginella moellendorffii]|uniref:Uncharacterized protein n=1 Tax=Selaginella moellendorffii TaxID=88036 RepID=D8RX26_SELML|nr:hypothetical protein SELMODRAFT_415732 [Selaginella moellendorffii]
MEQMLLSGNRHMYQLASFLVLDLAPEPSGIDLISTSTSPLIKDMWTLLVLLLLDENIRPKRVIEVFLECMSSRAGCLLSDTIHNRGPAMTGSKEELVIARCSSGKNSCGAASFCSFYLHLRIFTLLFCFTPSKHDIMVAGKVLELISTPHVVWLGLLNVKKIVNRHVWVRLEFKLKSVTESSGNGRPSYYDRSGGTQREYVVQVHRRHKYTLLPEYMREVIKPGESLKRQNQDWQLYTSIRHSMERFAMAEMSDDFPVPGGPDTRASKLSQLKNSLPPTQYDVYDMELTEVKSNADLRKLLMGIEL